MTSLSVESAAELPGGNRQAHPAADGRPPGLPPLVGVRLLLVSYGLALPYDRARSLEAFGYRLSACGDPRRAAEFIAEQHSDAVVVDLAREHGAPHETAALIRSVTDVPLIIVGCDGTYSEMLRCFEAGADDFCRPRCNTEEIDLRLRAIFRRRGIPESAQTGERAQVVLRIGDIEIDRATHTVRKNGEVVPLSPTEYRLLITLAEHRGEVIPSKALIARVWGNQCAGESHYLRLYVRYLRQKIEDDPSNPRYIVNRWGTGYTLDEPAFAA